MKTYFSKPPTHAQRIFSFWAILLCLLSGVASAQIFNPSTLTEYPFPAAGAVGNTNHSFTYTMSHIAYMTNFPTPPPPPPPYMPAPAPPAVPLSDLSVHCWDGAAGSPAGVGYLNTAWGAGTPPPAALIYDQGFIPYPATCRSLEASLMQDEMGVSMFIYGTNAPWYVIVSYYNAAGPGGPGHYVDVYKWNQPPPNGPGGLTLVGAPIQLSTIPVYTRISQDAHNTYGFCITWENPTAMAPGNGVNFVFGFMNPAIPGPSISPVYLLPGTGGEKSPDVAFTHSPATGINLQFLYFRKLGPNMRITESVIPMQFGPAWAAPPAPVINDVNLLPWACPFIDLKTRLDATDHWSDDWAYSYILPPVCGAINNDIFVRYDNAGVRTTYNLTNGSMGPLPCDIAPTGVSYLNDWPVCSFDQTTNWLNVEWYTQYQNGGAFFLPNTGGYIGLKMDNLGVIMSPFDYLQVAEAATGSNTLASITPTIASSRQNDRTDYQFVAFANQNAAGQYMVVKDRPWTSATFKSAGGGHEWSELYGGPTSAQNVSGAENNVTAYPNPFSNNLSLDISAGLQNETLKVTIEDLSGRMIGKTEGKGNAINASLNDISRELASGVYLLRLQSATGNFNKVLKVEKLSTN